MAQMTVDWRTITDFVTEVFTRCGVPPEDAALVIGRQYFVNTSSVGQPRDSDPRASYLIYEPAGRLVRFRRLEYDVASAQARVRDAGLPEHLAKRLAAGR